MFQLVKINNSKNNCPDFIKLSVEDSDVKLYKGSIVKRNGAGVTAPEGKHEFVVAGNYESGKDTELVAYEITPEMVFSTTVKGNTEMALPGARVSPTVSNPTLDVTDCVILDEDGDCKIVDVIGEKEGNLFVHVMFDWR